MYEPEHNTNRADVATWGLDRFAPFQLAERGLAVFPVAPGTKKPALRGWRQRSTSEFRQISRWQREYGSRINWAIDTGASGLLVVDVDTKLRSPDGWSWTAEQLHRFDTLLDERHTIPKSIVRTGNGGRQFLWHQPEIPIGNAAGTTPLGPGIDLRGPGGLVVAPGSFVSPIVVHPEATGHYAWLADGAIEDAPAWLVALLRGEPVPEIIRPAAVGWDPRLARWWERRMSGSAIEIGRAPVGGRNEVVNKQAYYDGQKLAGCEAPPEMWQAVREALIEAGLRAGLRLGEVTTTVDSGMNAGRMSPKPIARKLQVPKEIKVKRPTAKEWLAEFLDGRGPVPAIEVIAAGTEAGYSRRALFDAKANLSIISARSRTATWEVQIPERPNPKVQVETSVGVIDTVTPSALGALVEGAMGTRVPLLPPASLDSADRLHLHFSDDEQPPEPCSHDVGPHACGRSICTICRRWHEVRGLPWPCPDGLTPVSGCLRLGAQHHHDEENP